MIDDAAARVSPQDDLRSRGENDHALIERVVAVNSAPELDDALRQLVEAARDLLDADLVTLVAWDESIVRGVLCAEAGDGVGLVGEEVGPGSNPLYRAATTGEPIVERSSKAEGLPWTIAKAVRGLATRVTVPLAVQGAPVLTFQAAWRTRRSDAAVARSIRTLQTLGALTGIAYRAEDVRRRSRERALLETVLESVDNGLWLISEDSVIVNTAARRLLRLPGDATPDFRAFNLRMLDGQPLDVGFLTDVVESARQPQDFCFRVTRLDGVERIFEGTASPIVVGGGRVGTVSTFRDVTERHERVLLTERFLERLFDALPTGVILLHPTTRRLLSSNRAFARLVGYEPAEIEGTEPPFPWWTAARDDLHDGKWATPDGTLRVESLFRRKDGELLPVEILRFWIRDLDGTPLAAVALITDLSERLRFQQQLLVSGKLATIGELAAGVAHEINNPLFAILGLVEFLLKEAEPGTKSHHRLELVQETGLEIKATVRALLDFARERSDEQGVVSLREVLTQTVELMRLASAAKHVEIVERYCAEETFVHASSGQLKQVFVNLVANAQQAMPAGGRVEIELARDGDWVQVSVRDNGPGIPEEALARIFEPFFTTKRAGGGTGLGLPVSLGIAQMHGGELLARSKSGEGATFVLRLPAHRETVK